MSGRLLEEPVFGEGAELESARVDLRVQAEGLSKTSHETLKYIIMAQRSVRSIRVRTVPHV